MTCTLDKCETFAAIMQDERDEIQALIKSRSAPNVINARLQEIHEQLEALTVYSAEIARGLRSAGEKRWARIVGKRNHLSRRVKTLDLCAREYFNAEASKTILSNVNQTRVIPYAGEKRHVACAPNNDCKILHRKKISASDNDMNCRERQVPNVYSVSYARARPPEFRSYRQPNRLATAVALPNVFVRERPNTASGNKFAETPRSSGDVRSNFNEVAGIKAVVMQRYCGELVSKNRCGELRQKPDYPFVAPSSAVEKQPRA